MLQVVLGGLHVAKLFDRRFSIFVSQILLFSEISLLLVNVFLTNMLIFASLGVLLDWSIHKSEATTSKNLKAIASNNREPYSREI